MKRAASVLFIAGFLLAFSAPSHAQVGVAVRVGTLGPGIQAVVPVAPTLNVRAGASYLSFSRTESFTDLEVATDFDADARFGAATAFIDYHPAGGPFRVSGGLYYNLLDVSGTGRPTESYFLDEKEFTPERLGSLTIDARYKNKIQPYIGVGLGNLSSGGRVKFLLDIGAVYTGPPEFSMSGTGMISATANWQDDFNEGFSSFKWYPNVSIGLGFTL